MNKKDPNRGLIICYIWVLGMCAVAHVESLRQSIAQHYYE